MLTQEPSSTTRIERDRRATLALLGALCLFCVACAVGAWLLHFEAGLHPASFQSRSVLFYSASWLVPYVGVVAATFGVCCVMVLRRPQTPGVALVGAFVVGACGILALVLQPPGYVTFTRGLRVFAERSVDAAAIRQWRETDSPDRCGTIPAERWPDAVRALSPSFVEFERTPDGAPVARIVCGGGFGHWGVTVGPETMARPPADSGYVLLVEPGLFVWHDT